MTALNKPIQMICVCDVDGELRPLRFRFEDDEHCVHTVKVSEVLVAKELNYVGTQSFLYVCKALAGDREIMFELRYAVKAHKWVLFRYIN